ncbi:hypothetical protein TNCV_2091831 [Trichonephila clavipes]|nr:hypothetical protein TNCV_2091831 [Trichonephila clavipes]
MIDPSSFADPTPLAHADASRDVFPRGVLKANDRRTSCPGHDEFRGPRSDYVRQVALENTNSNVKMLLVALQERDLDNVWLQQDDTTVSMDILRAAFSK